MGSHESTIYDQALRSNATLPTLWSWVLLGIASAVALQLLNTWISPNAFQILVFRNSPHTLYPLPLYRILFFSALFGGVLGLYAGVLEKGILKNKVSLISRNNLVLIFVLVLLILWAFGGFFGRWWFYEYNGFYFGISPRPIDVLTPHAKFEPSKFQANYCWVYGSSLFVLLGTIPSVALAMTFFAKFTAAKRTDGVALTD